jgi:hypothetical protein
VSAVAWLVLGWFGAGDMAGAVPDHAQHAAGGPGSAAMSATMVVAMTAPFALPGARSVVFASLWWLGRRAVVCYTGAFLAGWLAIGTGLAVTAIVLTWAIPADSVASLLLLAAAVAQADPDRRRWLADCHRPPRIRVRPRDALRDWVRGGVVDAARCARLCVLPMLAMLALPIGIPFMVALSVLALGERISDGRRRVAVGIGYLLLALALAAVR